MEGQFDISVVIPTYNRSHLVAEAIQSILAQESDRLSYEVIVVDNNSPDNTRDIVRSFAGRNIPVRYVFEGQQGNAYARNAGITEAQAPIVAFIDDDIRAAPDWLATVNRTFAEHPQVGFIGGKVLPVWKVTPPPWLTPRHWMPLGLQDHGDTEFLLEPVGLTGVISANLAVRRDLLERVGMFSPALQLVKGCVGGMEDHDLVNRLWAQGVMGMYVPKLVVHTPIGRERTRKSYHRKWHKGHGRNYAVMREERMEKASWYLFGVPAHLYRGALIDVMEFFKHSLRRKEESAFLSEVHLWFFCAFWLQRVHDVRSR
jgi:glycosyltransferase involved in cell wall biosynthesis